MPNEKFIRKVVKNGRDSYYINIPKEIVKDLKIKERQKMVIKKRGKEILLTSRAIPLQIWYNTII